MVKCRLNLFRNKVFKLFDCKWVRKSRLSTLKFLLKILKFCYIYQVSISCLNVMYSTGYRFEYMLLCCQKFEWLKRFKRSVYNDYSLGINAISVYQAVNLVSTYLLRKQIRKFTCWLWIGLNFLQKCFPRMEQTRLAWRTLQNEIKIKHWKHPVSFAS